MNKPMVFSIVGFQDAGKTQVVEALVTDATSGGHQVAVIKHDGHADTRADTDWEKPTSDTARAARSGARWTMVASRNGWMIHAWDDAQDGVDDWIEKLLSVTQREGAVGAGGTSQLDAVGPDVILVEGAKGSNLPKVLIANEHEMLNRLLTLNLPNVLCICWTGDPELASHVETPVFFLSHTAELWRFLKERLGFLDNR